MKILWITDNFLPHYGGSRVLYYEIMRCFNRGEVALLTGRTPGWREFDALSGVSTTRLPFVKLPLPQPFDEIAAYAGMLLGGACLMLRSGADVIVCGEVIPAGVSGRILSAVSGKPYIVYVHGEELGVYERLRGEKKLAFSVLRSADAVIAASSIAMEKALQAGVPPGKVHLLTPAVAGIFFTREPTPDRILSRHGLSGKRVILTVGRLVERKGHAQVIRALRALLGEYPDIAYLIVGEGTGESELKVIAREEGVEDAVVFAGRVSEEELVDCYAACDIFVMPNRELESGEIEGAGIVFLEAAAMGRPVIAGRSGGTGDSVVDGETGYRVDPDSLEDLVSRLRLLLGDRGLRDRMGKAGREMVSRERRWQSRASGFIKICEKCTEERRRNDQGPLHC